MDLKSVSDQSVFLQVISQLVAFHPPQDRLFDLLGPFSVVLLDHQVHGFGSICCLKPAGGDQIRLQTQEMLEGF